MKILKGYKLFEMNKEGKLFPLFIGKTIETPVQKWVKAEIVKDHKGYADRPGWHLGATMPSAPWLMSINGTYKSQRGKTFKRIWCEVEYIADVDYTSIVETLPKKCFTNKLPEGGFYNFRESGDRLWIIADRIKITKILNEEERLAILSSLNYDEMAEFESRRQELIKSSETRANNKKKENKKKKKEVK